MGNDEMVVAELGRLSAGALDPDDLEGYESSAADYLIATQHRTNVPESELATLVQLLQQTSWLTDLEGGIVNTSPFDSASLSLSSLAHWLVAQARTRAPGACWAELRDLVACNVSQVFEVVPVWGMSPKTRFSLGEGVEIVPVGDLPPSKLKDLFTGTKRHRFSFDLANSAPRPGAALLRSGIHGPIFEPRDSDAALRMREQSEVLLLAALSESLEERQRAMERLEQLTRPPQQKLDEGGLASEAEDLLAVVALLCPRPLFAVGNWLQRPHSVPVAGQSFGYSGPTNDHPFYIPIEPEDYPVAKIQDLVGRYRSLALATRKRLRTPLLRLNQGRRQLGYHTIEGAALEFGTAAEALLTQDRDHDAPISFLLRVRGALLLGGSASDRRTTYRCLKALYDLRSRAAHDGVLIDLHGKRDAATAKRHLECHEALAAGERVCIQMMLRVIDAGGFPIWDDVMLGI